MLGDVLKYRKSNKKSLLQLLQQHSASPIKWKIFAHSAFTGQMSYSFTNKNTIDYIYIYIYYKYSFYIYIYTNAYSRQIHACFFFSCLLSHGDWASACTEHRIACPNSTQSILLRQLRPQNEASLSRCHGIAAAGQLFIKVSLKRRTRTWGQSDFWCLISTDLLYASYLVSMVMYTILVISIWYRYIHIRCMNIQITCTWFINY